MNTLLDKLLKEYNLRPEDIYEIKQIYSFLSYEKQQKLIQNFKTLATKIKEIEKDIKTQREILVEITINEIREVIELVKNEKK